MVQVLGQSLQEHAFLLEEKVVSKRTKFCHYNKSCDVVVSKTLCFCDDIVMKPQFFSFFIFFLSQRLFLLWQVTLSQALKIFCDHFGHGNFILLWRSSLSEKLKIFRDHLFCHNNPFFLIKCIHWYHEQLWGT